MTTIKLIAIGKYNSLAKMREASTLKGNFRRVLKCGKTYSAQGTDKREIRANLQAVLGEDMPKGRLTYTEVPTVSRGRETGKTHFVCTISLAKGEPAPERKPKAVTPKAKSVEALEADVCSLMSENKRLHDENEELRTRLAELSAALEMLSAHATK